MAGRRIACITGCGRYISHGSRCDECKPERQRNGWTWAAFREQIKRRDDHTCVGVGCGATEGLHVHHIRPLHRGGQEFDESNCVTLCRACDPDRGGSWSPSI